MMARRGARVLGAILSGLIVALIIGSYAFLLVALAVLAIVGAPS